MPFAAAGGAHTALIKARGYRSDAVSACLANGIDHGQQFSHEASGNFHLGRPAPCPRFRQITGIAEPGPFAFLAARAAFIRSD